MDFPEAMQAVIQGRTVTKLEWDDMRYYGELRDGFLMLHKPDGKFYQWVISEGDLTGTDYILLDLDSSLPS